MSKGITGGFVPFGALWTGPQVVEYYDTEKMACGLTNYAHPLGLAALGAVMDLLADPAFQENKQTLERIFGETLLDLGKQAAVRQVRFSGLLGAIEFHEQVAPKWQAMFDTGLHAFSNENTVVLAPPFISTPEHLSDALGVLNRLLHKAA